MKKLTYPQIDNIDLWKKIVSRKHRFTRKKLLSIQDKIARRYAFYSEHFNSLDEILPLPKAEWSDVKEELISCYSNNIEFKKVKRQIFDHLSEENQTKCPYCMLSRPNTLEHYFDKDDYPEFSVYVPNLIPCCSECNSNKSTSVLDSEHNRKYIHFYHDLIPEEQFLFVRFSFSEFDSVPQVNITLKFSEDNYYTSLINRHFEDLSLISKYSNIILDRLAPLMEEIRMNQQSGISTEIIITSLRNRLKSLSAHYGNNYWETCLYEGVLNSPDFLKQLLSD